MSGSARLFELIQLRNKLLKEPQTQEVMEKLANVDLLIKLERSKSLLV